MELIEEENVLDHTICYHCGNDTSKRAINHDSRSFCCEGCKTVYELITENGLDDYYQYERTPGQTMDTDDDDRYLFLENEKVVESLIDYQVDELSGITLSIPDIHCSSCIWLLENLSRINPSVKESRVNFSRKQATIRYEHKQLSLRELAIILTNIGYPPMISGAAKKENERGSKFGSSQIKLGVAGFCFGNVMLLSFPEYFGIDISSSTFISLFGWLNLIFAIPVLVYSANDYLLSAWKSLQQRYINIDVPIAIGILVLFGRSAYEILSGTGAGFFDSFTGLIFFLLIGRWFQSRTYDILSFERDYKSYFPLAVSRMKNDATEIIPIDQIEAGDRLKIRNQEIIPVDCVLQDSMARMDYSFVTGEQEPVKVLEGEKLFAGGKLLGTPIQVEVLKSVSQSYLTSLWNLEGKRPEERSKKLLDSVGKYFTLIILGVAALTGGYWALAEPQVVWQSVTAVLIVACPCALALSIPFTFGNTMRMLGRNAFYLKSADIVEKFYGLTHIIFDKTGTLTLNSKSNVVYQGKDLTREEFSVLNTMSSSSVHPYSRRLSDFFSNRSPETLPLESFGEYTGQGIEATYQGRSYKLGSSEWVRGEVNTTTSAAVHCSINNEYMGSFTMETHYRPGLKQVLTSLAKNFSLSLFSGDSSRERAHLEQIFPDASSLVFQLKPDEKKERLMALQAKEKVMMIGDGLNDAPALIQADLGVSIVEDISVFTPASDVIMKGDALEKLPALIRFIKSSRTVLIMSIIISFLYNTVGLYFAVTGVLTPVFAAILMPLSSISVVIFTTLAVRFTAMKNRLI